MPSIVIKIFILKKWVKTMNNESISMNIFDKEEIYKDCTVQILSNTVTEEKSIGWWENKRWHKAIKDQLPDINVLAFSKESGQQMIGFIYWDENCDCFICDYEGILMFDVSHWSYLLPPPEEDE